MEENPLEQAVDDALGGAVLFMDFKKWASMKTVRTYSKAMIAGGVALPVSFALSGTPAISQERAKEPEVTRPHVPSQSQATTVRGPVAYVSGTSNSISHVIEVPAGKLTFNLGS